MSKYIQIGEKTAAQRLDNGTLAVIQADLLDARKQHYVYIDATMLAALVEMAAQK